MGDTKPIGSELLSGFPALAEIYSLRAYKSNEQQSK
jgi:hypothetical protein